MQCNTIQRNDMQYNVMKYNAVQCNSIHCSLLISIENPKTGIERGKDGDWTIQGVAAGFYAVDSFFLMR